MVYSTKISIITNGDKWRRLYNNASKKGIRYLTHPLTTMQPTYSDAHPSNNGFLEAFILFHRSIWVSLQMLKNTTVPLEGEATPTHIFGGVHNIWLTSTFLHCRPNCASPTWQGLTPWKRCSPEWFIDVTIATGCSNCRARGTRNQELI